MDNHELEVQLKRLGVPAKVVICRDQATFSAEFKRDLVVGCAFFSGGRCEVAKHFGVLGACSPGEGKRVVPLADFLPKVTQIQEDIRNNREAGLVNKLSPRLGR